MLAVSVSGVCAVYGPLAGAGTTKPGRSVPTVAYGPCACATPLSRFRPDAALSSKRRVPLSALKRVPGTHPSCAVSRTSLRVHALFGPPPDPKVLLTEGKALYATGERMRGYKMFEKALRADDALIPLATRQELLFSCMCCNAAFGDVEIAKQFLRDMNIAGMSFESAMGRSDFMTLEAGAQMRNQLIKFASGEMKSQGTVQREIFEKSRAAPGGSVGSNSAGQKPQRMGDMDLMNLDIAGDTSAEAGDIAKRVGGLVVASILGFILLFEGGLTLLR